MPRTKGALNKKKVSEVPKKAPKRRSEKPIDQLVTDTFISPDNSEDDD